MLGMEKKINAFIERLASEQVGSLTENIYLDKHKQENLRLYLMALCKNKPTYRSGKKYIKGLYTKKIDSPYTVYFGGDYTEYTDLAGWF